MPTLLSRLKLRGLTTAQRTAFVDALQYEAVIDTDTDTLWYWDGSAWVNTGLAGSIPTTPYQNGTDGSGGQITAAGNTNIALDSTDLRKSVKIEATGGAGIYTATITLQTTNAAAGDRIKLRLTLPASANPTLEIRNATSGGTLLHSLNNADAVAALLWTGEFVYTGTAWEFWGGNYHSA